MRRLLVVVGFLWVNWSWAETLFLYPSADTSIMEAFPGNNFGGNEFFNSGTTQNFTTNRGLLKFDIAEVLPAKAKILAVSLTLEVVGSSVAGDLPSSFVLHRLLQDWGEGNKAGHPPQQPYLGQPATDGEATFLYRFASTNQWDTPGASPGVDYVAEFSADTFVYGENFSPYTFDSTERLVADVEHWIAHTNENFGWMLISRDETNDFTARRFASREDPPRAPLLTVEYFVPRITHISLTNDAASIKFTAQPGFTYRLESLQDPGCSSWLTVSNIPRQDAAIEINILDVLTPPARLYRLVVE
jgi:hypothetical protein